MSLDLLYSEEVRDYAKYRRFCGEPSSWTHTQRGHNPQCGDDIVIFINIENGIIKECRWNGDGCALAVASASMMAEMLKNKTTAEAETILSDILNGITISTEEINNKYAPLDTLNAVKTRPLRVKCALLAWRALEAILLQTKNLL